MIEWKWEILWCLLLGLISFLFRQIQYTALGRLILSLRFVISGATAGFICGALTFGFHPTMRDRILLPAIIILFSALPTWFTGRGVRRPDEVNPAHTRIRLILKTVLQYLVSLLLVFPIGLLFRGKGDDFPLNLGFFVDILMYVMPNFLLEGPKDEGGPPIGRLIKVLLKREANRYAPAADATDHAATPSRN